VEHPPGIEPVESDGRSQGVEGSDRATDARRQARPPEADRGRGPAMEDVRHQEVEQRMGGAVVWHSAEIPGSPEAVFALAQVPGRDSVQVGSGPGQIFGDGHQIVRSQQGDLPPL
jgi:hypothetical protein